VKNSLMVILLVTFLCFTFGCQEREAMAELEALKDQSGVEDQNMQIIKRFFASENLEIEEMFAALDELLAPDFIAHSLSGDLKGPEGMKKYIEANARTFSDMKHTIEDIFARADKVAVRCRFHATQIRDFLGISPKGNQIDISAIYIFRVEDGKIQEEWVEADFKGMIEQLGMELKLKEEK
jgi:predicted ester cyclase